MLASLLMIVLTAQDIDSAPPILRPGETIDAEITDAAREVHTPTLDTNYTQAPTVGVTYRIQVESSGPYHVDLRSYDFDSYLVLRDESGQLLGEDDDGLIGVHSQLGAELEAGRVYLLSACALHSVRGVGETILRAGRAPELSPIERSRLSLADARVRVARAEDRHGPEHLDTATALHLLALELYYSGDFATARSFLERALAIRERTLEPAHPDLLANLNDLAVVMWGLGVYADARQLHERVLAIQEDRLGPEGLDVGTSLNNLAQVLQSQGDYTGARPLLERALAIREKALEPGHPDVALSLNNLAAVLCDQGHYEDARPLYERVLALREHTLGPDHSDVAISMSNLAGVIDILGDSVGAQTLYERALAVSERTRGSDHPDVATVLNGLAVLLASQGDYAAARPLHERALAIWENLRPDHPNVATSLDHLGGLLYLQGDYVGARSRYEHSIAILESQLGPSHPNVATGMNDLAVVLHSMEDHEAARPLYERALAISEAELGPNHLDVAKPLNNLGLMWLSEGDCSAARPLLARSLSICEEVLGPGHPDVAMSMNNMAALLVQEGDYAGARSQYESALTIWVRMFGPLHPNVAMARSSLAQLMFDLNELDAAHELLVQAATARRNHVRATMAGLSESEAYRILSALHWQFELWLSIGSAREGAGNAAETYAGLLEWKGRVAREIVASRERLPRDVDDGQRANVERLRSAQARLSRLLSDPPTSTAGRRAYDDRIATLLDERNTLELEMVRALDAAAPSRVLSAEDIAGSLPPRSAVLDLFVHRLYEPARIEDDVAAEPGSWSDEHACAWIVRSVEEGVVRVDLGPAVEMERAVQAFLQDLVARRGVGTGTGTKESTASNEFLRDLLWDPVAEHLADVDTVFVSPDGFLGTVPLETLALEDGSFLVERFAFVYVQDVSSLSRHGDEPKPDYGSLLAMGGIDFRQRAEWEGAPSNGESHPKDRGGFGEYWGSLPATEYESQVVADLHADAFGDEARRLLLQGPDPSEERLKHELPRHSVLHLATHGFFQPEGTPSMWESALNERGQEELRMSEVAAQLVGKHPGLLSGLVCAGANADPEEGRDDGLLTAEEVGWLDLSNVELVVMSACETGLGRVQSGEGLIGLRRAFRTAGSKTVISSLWSVKDESTAELMQDFYVNLWMKGMGRLEALRSAQLAMLKKNRIEHGHGLPSTWGAFVLSGEWR